MAIFTFHFRNISWNGFGSNSLNSRWQMCFSVRAAWFCRCGHFCHLCCLTLTLQYNITSLYHTEKEICFWFGRFKRLLLHLHLVFFYHHGTSYCGIVVWPHCRIYASATTVEQFCRHSSILSRSMAAGFLVGSGCDQLSPKLLHSMNNLAFLWCIL